MKDDFAREMGYVVAVILIAIIAMFCMVYAIPNAPEPEAKVTVTAFTAEWCRSCRKIRPILIAIRARGVIVRIVDIDTREGEVLARKLGVTSVPTFFVRTKSGVTKTQNISVVLRIIKESGK